MTDFFITLLTSENCGHCHQFRGDGFINNGKKYMDAKFIKNFLSHDNKTTSLINIHYSTMNGDLNSVANISKIYLENNLLVQERFYEFENKTRVTVLKQTRKGIKKIVSDFINDNNNPVLWKEFISSKIPKNIVYYSFFFPCFLIIKKSNWKESLTNNTALMAIINAGKTIRDEEGNIGIHKDAKSLYSRNVQPEILAKQAFEDKLVFKPDIDNFKEKKVTEKNDEIKVVKETPVNGYIIKNYDDE